MNRRKGHFKSLGWYIQAGIGRRIAGDSYDIPLAHLLLPDSFNYTPENSHDWLEKQPFESMYLLVKNLRFSIIAMLVFVESKDIHPSEVDETLQLHELVEIHCYALRVITVVTDF